MGKKNKSKKSKALVEPQRQDQYNLPLNDRSLDGYSMGSVLENKPQIFKNQSWTRVIQIGVSTATSISLCPLQ